MSKKNKNQGAVDASTVVQGSTEQGASAANVATTVEASAPVEQTKEQKANRLAELTSQYRAAKQAQLAGEKALEDAKLANSDVIRAMVEEFGTDGKLTINIDGKQKTASHRNDLWFLKEPKGSTISID